MPLPVCFHSILCIFFPEPFESKLWKWCLPLVFNSWRSKKSILYNFGTVIRIRKKIIILLSSLHYSNFINCYNNVLYNKRKNIFFCSGIQSKNACCTYFWCLLVLKLFVKYPTIWLVWYFLIIKIKLYSFGRNITKEKVFLQYIILKMYILSLFPITDNVKSDNLVNYWKISNCSLCN